MFSIPDRLPAFLCEQAARPFVLGESDCGLWLADWAIIALNLRHDPASHLRGRYRTPEEWNAFSNGGGLFGLVDSIASGLFLKKTTDAQPGDIGVLTVGNIETGGIMGFRNWMVRSGFRDGGPGVARIQNPVTRCTWCMN